MSETLELRVEKVNIWYTVKSGDWPDEYDEELDKGERIVNVVVDTNADPMKYATGENKTEALKAYAEKYYEGESPIAKGSKKVTEK
jgi:hypothetical protein